MLQSTTSEKHCIWRSELGDSNTDCSFILNFLLMFTLQEKLINSILIFLKNLITREQHQFGCHFEHFSLCIKCIHMWCFDRTPRDKLRRKEGAMGHVYSGQKVKRALFRMLWVWGPEEAFRELPGSPAQCPCPSWGTHAPLLGSHRWTLWSRPCWTRWS